VTTELRYYSITDVELEEEGGAAKVTGLNYQPLTIGVGVAFRF